MTLKNKQTKNEWKHNYINTRGYFKITMRDFVWKRSDSACEALKKKKEKKKRACMWSAMDCCEVVLDEKDTESSKKKFSRENQQHSLTSECGPLGRFSFNLFTLFFLSFKGHLRDLGHYSRALLS